MPTLKLHYEGGFRCPPSCDNSLARTVATGSMSSGRRDHRVAAHGHDERPAPRADQEAAIDFPAPERRDTDAHRCHAGPSQARTTTKARRRRRTRRADPEAPRGRPRAMRVPEPERVPLRAVTNGALKVAGARRDLQRQARACPCCAAEVPDPDRARSQAVRRRRKSGVASCYVEGV